MRRKGTSHQPSHPHRSSTPAGPPRLRHGPSLRRDSCGKQLMPAPLQAADTSSKPSSTPSVDDDAGAPALDGDSVEAVEHVRDGACPRSPAMRARYHGRDATQASAMWHPLSSLLLFSCPTCCQDRGPAAVRKRAPQNTAEASRIVRVRCGGHAIHLLRSEQPPCALPTMASNDPCGVSRIHSET